MDPIKTEEQCVEFLERAVAHYREYLGLAEDDVAILDAKGTGLRPLFGAIFGLDFDIVPKEKKEGDNFNVAVLRNGRRSISLVYKCIYFKGEDDSVPTGWPKVILAGSIEGAYKELKPILKKTRGLLWDADRHWDYWGHAEHDETTEVSIVYMEDPLGESASDRIVIVGPAVLDERR